MGMRWWYQASIDLVGDRETVVAAADEDGMEE